MEKLSIVVLFHNNRHFNYVISALLNQMESNDEIIIVNDHSNAEYLKVLEIYLGKSNIRIVNSDRTGNRSRNRNIGANLAQNNYLVFVDGDIVLMENCLNLLRMTLASGYAGAFGNIINGGNTPEQMNLLVGFDYLKFLKGHPNLKDFFKYHIASDHRSNLIPENFIYRSEWQYFYSGYCAVAKEAFDKCGKFNENFKGWGAEDVEFGYRLEKINDIKFVNGAYAYHLSHDRDLYSIMQSNKKNLYWFFSQRPNVELEIFLSFHLSTGIVDVMNCIKEKVRNMNLEDKHNLQKIGELSVLIASPKYPDGNVAYIGEDGKIHQFNLIGVALPFNDNQFNQVNLSTDIFCYPESIATRILQECYRVSQQVYIFKTTMRNHICWETVPMSTLLSRRSSMDRTNYYAHQINDFTFADKGSYYIITGGIATKMPYVHINNLPDVYLHKKSNKREYILFDLTNRLTDSDIKKISELNNISILGVYKLKLRSDQNILRLSEIILGELQVLNIPFVYIIEKDTKMDENDIWWNYKARHNDKIIIYHE